VVFAHRTNIKRLLAGKENRVGHKVLEEDIEQVQDEAIEAVAEAEEPTQPEEVAEES
jgi:hypothetical protein